MTTEPPGVERQELENIITSIALSDPIVTVDGVVDYECGLCHAAGCGTSADSAVIHAADCNWLRCVVLAKEWGRYVMV